MAKGQPLSIYPKPELRRRIEALAEERDRSLNKQVLWLLKAAVTRIERRRQRQQLA